MSLRAKALWLVLAAVLLAILGDWSGQLTLQRLWRLPAALLLLGLAYEGWRVSRTALWLQVRTRARWCLGRPTAVRLELHTSGERELTVQLLPEAPPEVAVERSLTHLLVRRDQPGFIELTATVRRLGRFQWPASPARIGGVLGLAWWSRQLEAQQTLQAIPDLVRDRERGVAAGQRGVQPAQQPGAGSEVLQLREYRVGDPPRAIDWKASARLGRAISRDFAADQGLQIVLVVDASRASSFRAGSTDRLALYANVACRLAQRAVQFDDHVGLVAYAERPLVAIAPARGLSAVLRVRAVLAQLRVQETTANPLVAALRVRSLVHHRSLVVLLTGLDEAAVLPGLAAAVRLLRPTHLPLIAAVDSEQAERLAVARVADTAQAYQALAAQQFRATVGRNLQGLRAMGAQAVLSAAEHLDQAVLESYLRLRQQRRVG
jgi:uncharacterized protein (DUF58 family)